jgi:hypothetical protein
MRPSKGTGKTFIVKPYAFLMACKRETLVLELKSNFHNLNGTYNDVMFVENYALNHVKVTDIIKMA